MGFDVGAVVGHMILKRDRWDQSVKTIKSNMKKLDATIQKQAANMRTLGVAIAAVGTAVTVMSVKFTKSMIRASSVTEQYKLRLDALLGSQKESAMLFKEMTEFASKVPFEYEQIMDSATQLSGVLRGGAKEVKALMPLISDLAAVSGFNIRTTTQQIIRMFSAGAASADLFRERGILAMLGFKAGVSFTADETRKKVIEAWLDVDSKFRGVIGKMADTWVGQVSMMRDKWFLFLNMVGRTGIFDNLKGVLKSINKFMEQNNEAIEGFIKRNATLIQVLMVGVPLLGAMAIGLGGILVLLPSLSAGVMLLGKTFQTFWIKALAPALPFLAAIALVGAAIIALRAVILQNLEGIQNLFGGLVSNIQEGFSVLWQNISLFLTTLTKEWAFVIDGLWKTMKDLFNLTVRGFHGLGLAIAKVLKGDFSEALDAFLSVKDKDYLPQLEKLGNSVVDKMEWIKLKVTSLAGSQKEIFKGIWEDIKNQAGEDLDKLVSLIKEKMPQLAGAMEATDFSQALRNLQAQGPSMDQILSEWEGKWSDFHKKLPETQLAMLEKMRAQYLAAGANKLDVDRWYQKKLKALQDDLVKDLKGWSAISIKIVESAAQGMEDVMSDFFFDAFKGKLKTLGDYIVAWSDFVMKAVSQALAQAVVEQTGIKTAVTGVLGAVGAAFSGPKTTAVGTTSVQTPIGVAADGIERVPRTGIYKLHQDEEIVPRRFADQGSGGAQELVIINNITPEAVAMAMASKQGEGVIVNTIDRNAFRNGPIRRMVQRG